MDTTRFDRSVQTLAQATGRRTALRSFGTMGMALLAALGLADASAKGAHKGGESRVQAERKRKKKRKTKRGPGDPAGRAGFETRLVVSGNSEPLPTDGGIVSAFADCGEEGKVVSCGYALGGSAEQLVNVLVQNVGPDGNRFGCAAFLRRTTEVGSTAGAVINATALCLV